ncbi:hypothetical protein N9V56_04210 [Alphaproteobacteria bacterium]|nr:hypothetical protein [Alphaproteobacteria bacterium]
MENTATDFLNSSTRCFSPKVSPFGFSVFKKLRFSNRFGGRTGAS